ncbi:hypothetical protein LINPERHAP1_LOCUS19015 [Linum perenne]
MIHWFRRNHQFNHLEPSRESRRNHKAFSAKPEGRKKQSECEGQFRREPPYGFGETDEFGPAQLG